MEFSMTNISNIITLTTDFSTEDGYVGAMKGKILSIASQANIQDITHHIEPQNILMASWCIFRSARHFPTGSVHIVVVDPGVGSERNPLLLNVDKQWYIGPDNGVFTEILRHAKETKIYKIHTESDLWKKHQSFDGLNVFAPAAAHLLMGKDLRDLGYPTKKVIMLPNTHIKKSSNCIEGEIILFDQFGNAVSNIRKSDLDEFNGKLTIYCSDHQFKVVDHYQKGKKNCPIAIINSDHLLELSVYCGSAQNRFNLKIGDKVRLG